MQILLNLISHKTLFKNKKFHKACNFEVKMKEFGKINILISDFCCLLPEKIAFYLSNNQMFVCLGKVIVTTL